MRATRQILTLESMLVEVVVSATRPSSASDGEDITEWRSAEGFAPALAALLIDGTETLTLSSPTGGTDGPELWGYRLNKWWRLGYLNNGSDIVIAGAGQGFGTELAIIGLFERLAIAGTPSAGSATATIVPLQEWQIP